MIIPHSCSITFQMGVLCRILIPPLIALLLYHRFCAITPNVLATGVSAATAKGSGGPREGLMPYLMKVGEDTMAVILCPHKDHTLCTLFTPMRT
jgi:hypothetical protein